MMPRRFAPTIVVVAVGLAFVIAPAASSAGKPTTEERVFGIKPSITGKTTLEGGHFAYAVEPGATIADEATVVNYTDESINVRIYPADVRSAKGGALAPAQRDERMRGTGAWIELDDPEMATLGIAPHQQRVVPFRLRVPKTAVPGDHPGALVAALDLGANGRGVNVQVRAALMVRLTVLGDVVLGVDVGRITSHPTEGGYRVDVPVRNTGNVLFTTNGLLNLRRGGRTIATLPLRPHGIYVIPDGETTLSVLWRRPPKLGRVEAVARVAASVGDRPARTFTSERTFTFVPWLASGLVLTALALGSVLLVCTRPRRRARRQRRNVGGEIIREHRRPRSVLAGGPRD